MGRLWHSGWLVTLLTAQPLTAWVRFPFGVKDLMFECFPSDLWCMAGSTHICLGSFSTKMAGHCYQDHDWSLQNVTKNKHILSHKKSLQICPSCLYSLSFLVFEIHCINKIKVIYTIAKFFIGELQICWVEWLAHCRSSVRNMELFA